MMAMAKIIVVRRGGWFQGEALVDSLPTRSAPMTTDMLLRRAELALFVPRLLRVYGMNPNREQEKNRAVAIRLSRKTT